MNGWFVNYTAMDDKSLCQWTGVTCDNDTLVALDLSGYGAKGDDLVDQMLIARC